MPALTHLILLRRQREQAMLERIFNAGCSVFFSTVMVIADFRRDKSYGKRQAYPEKRKTLEGKGFSAFRQLPLLSRAVSGRSVGLNDTEFVEPPTGMRDCVN
jgi:hypothetical protein